MYINNVLYCFYSSDTEALEACFRLLHDDDDDDDSEFVIIHMCTRNCASNSFHVVHFLQNNHFSQYKS